jgi:hypothetical protein
MSRWLATVGPIITIPTAVPKMKNNITTSTNDPPSQGEMKSNEQDVSEQPATRELLSFCDLFFIYCVG